MAFFEDVGAADHTSVSEVVIGGIAGADSLTSVDGPRSAISMAPFEAADHTSGSELDKLRDQPPIIRVVLNWTNYAKSRWLRY